MPSVLHKESKIGENVRMNRMQKVERFTNHHFLSYFNLCGYPKPLKTVHQSLTKQRRARSNAPQADNQFITDNAKPQYRKQGKA